MVTRRLTLAAAFALIAVPAARADALAMPSVVAEDLNQARYTLPAELPSDKTIVVLSLRREQERQVQAWKAWFKMQGDSVNWLLLPIIDDPGAEGRLFIDNAMRGAVLTPEERAKIITVYANRAAMMKAMAITQDQDVTMAVMNRQGHILARVEGDFTEAKANVLKAAL